MPHFCCINWHHDIRDVLQPFTYSALDAQTLLLASSQRLAFHHRKRNYDLWFLYAMLFYKEGNGDVSSTIPEEGKQW